MIRKIMQSELLKVLAALAVLWIALCVLGNCTNANASDPTAGPVFGLWHIDGHGYQWQREQLDAGRPLEPCIRIGNWWQLQGTTFLLGEADAAILKTFDGMPVVLRMNNITQELDWTFQPRPIITEENWQDSFLAIRRLSDGRLDDTPNPSPFAGTDAWEAAGRIWATSPWMKRLQEILPNPASVILRENNEGAILTFGSLYISQHVRRRNHNGVLVFVSLQEWNDGKYSRDELVTPPDGNPLLPGDFVGRGRDNNLFYFRWKTAEQLDRIDLRAKEWVATRRHKLPSDVQAEFENLYRVQFRALADAFDAHLSDGWRGTLRTCGYGDFDENRHHDAASLFTYMGIYRPVSLTDPYHAKEITARRAEWAADENPQSWRELSIRHRQPTMFQPAQQGQHDVVDAESFAGYMLHNVWAMQSPGKEVRLVWYEDYLTTVDDLLVSSPSWQDAAVDLGREDLLTLTIGDCEAAVMDRLREIHSHPILRRYWQEGTTEIAASTDNTDTEHRVYATLTTIPGETRKLLHVYTPCSVEQLPTIEAAGIRLLPWARSAYYLTNPLESLPAVEPEPLTLDQRVERLEQRVFGQESR